MRLSENSKELENQFKKITITGINTSEENEIRRGTERHVKNHRKQIRN